MAGVGLHYPASSHPGLAQTPSLGTVILLQCEARPGLRPGVDRAKTRHILAHHSPDEAELGPVSLPCAPFHTGIMVKRKALPGGGPLEQPKSKTIDIFLVRAVDLVVNGIKLVERRVSLSVGNHPILLHYLLQLLNRS
ncbi:hypothetical protein NDU88_006857 [Pleurodeles waltl]|uniref:Uncharacterized protein n=1 Tax=Pleurodeles waltl TaxID=8319 RepID=A0AAV7QJ20_PLEWA|nr:hypothetical protein NDU88_006857 [Pleurodeles waltl]